MSWILTFTGRKFWPLDPAPADVCLEDIAHALSLTCRFGGHCREFYSVAQHSVLCSEYLTATGASAELQMAGLLHDAAEAYLPDVVRPVKGRLWVSDGAGLVKFGRAENAVTKAICQALGLEHGFCHLPQIKEADLVLLMTEKRDLMAPSDEPWECEAPRLWNTILPFPPRIAELAFLERYETLRRRMADPLSHIVHRTIGTDPEGGAA